MKLIVNYIKEFLDIMASVTPITLAALAMVFGILMAIIVLIK